MKRILSIFAILLSTTIAADAYQVISSKELGKNDAKNQNVVVKCTTDTGKVSNQTCNLRRYAKCSVVNNETRCSGWQPWRDLRNPSREFSDWKTAASNCCRTKGLR